jgi:4a-hydroxytetrahydrobiopterin dehydratase
MAEVPSKLTEAEIADHLSRLNAWEITDGKLSRVFQFDDFMGAVDFVNKVARVAEQEGHHPDLLVSWGRVVVYLSTHSAGGLTTKDFGLASLVEAL